MTFSACVKLYFPYKLHKRDTRGHRQAIHLALLLKTEAPNHTPDVQCSCSLFGSTSPLWQQLEPARTPCWAECSRGELETARDFLAVIPLYRMAHRLSKLSGIWVQGRDIVIFCLLHYSVIGLKRRITYKLQYKAVWNLSCKSVG